MAFENPKYKQNLSDQFGFVALSNMTPMFIEIMKYIPIDGKLGIGAQLISDEGIPSFLAIVRNHLSAPLLTFHLKPL